MMSEHESGIGFIILHQMYLQLNFQLAKNNYIALQVLSKEELWLDSEIFKKLPKFSSVSIFTQHHEKGFDNNKLLYNWNRLINVCKSKQILLIMNEVEKQINRSKKRKVYVNFLKLNYHLL